MKSTRASIHPAERYSVSLNQSVQGVSRTKLALLTTNPPPPPQPSLHPPTPQHTQDESVSRALPRHALFQQCGSGWRPLRADYIHRGVYRLLLVLDSVLAWHPVTDKDKKIHPRVKEGEISVHLAVSCFYFLSVFVCCCWISFTSAKNKTRFPSRFSVAEISETDIQHITQHLSGELTL